ncbi:MAG: cupin domain-containing protein [Xanthobacteraceae bacterium]|nr:cupin domain-containing protein [Xanthobacteraceae bacterium]
MPHVHRSSADPQVPQDLRAAWDRLRMAPLWEFPNAQVNERADEKPHIWRWSEIQPVLHETAKVEDPTSIERRVLSLRSSRSRGPDEDMTCGVMNATYQTLLPGERARPHRHSMSALRFVVEGGPGVETVVDGKACTMEPGDLILTPGWTWHEHVHHGKELACWVDILDVQLHRVIGTEAFQPGPARDVPLTFPDQMFHVPGVVPALEGAWHPEYSPMFRYPWGDVLRAMQLVPRMDDGSKTVRYTNPLTGGSCLGLLDCYAIELRGGSNTVARRSSASSIFVVVEGTGVSTIGGAELRWGPHDVFTAPQNKSFFHRADSAGARLFCTSDREIYRRLGLLREVTEISAVES